VEEVEFVCDVSITIPTAMMITANIPEKINNPSFRCFPLPSVF
jgi:hypothetical protein